MNTTETKRSKRFVSILVILLCLALGVGATYAYFTDKATSGNNKVQAGTLNIDFQVWNTESNNWNSIKDEESAVFTHKKWEPGYTDLQIFKVVNQGSLALQWEARIESQYSPSPLAKVIDVYMLVSDEEISYPTSREALNNWEKKGTLYEIYNNLADFIFGELTQKDDCAYFGIALHMQEEAGNDYRYQSLGEFDIVIYATQISHESDAFGPDYDDNTEFPPEKVRYAELTYELSDNGEYYIVTGIKSPEKHIIIPDTHEQDGVTLPVCGIANEAFFYCEDEGTEDDPGIYGFTIESITVSQNLKFIGDNAFEHCVIKNLVLPSTLESIGEYAFYNCTIDQILLSEGLKSIGRSAFQDCTFGTITLPQSLTSIGSYAFANVTVNELTISEGITKIEPFTFSSAKIETITLPNSLRVIGESAFEYALIDEIVVPEGVEEIEFGAFGDSSFKKITLPSTLKKIGSCVFYWCRATEIIIPKDANLTEIGSEAFYGCDYLQSIVIPASVTTIDWGAFAGSECLTIFACAEFAPAGWSEEWNYDNNPVVWGWNDTKYTYTFETNGGSTCDSITSSLVINLPTTQKTGMHFAGWYDNADCTGDMIEYRYFSTTNHTLYAKWLTDEEWVLWCDGTTLAKAIEIGTGDKAITLLNQEATYCVFVPQESGIYNFTTSTNMDTYATLYDSNIEYLCSDDDSGEGSNFSFYIRLTAGETYYLKLKMYYYYNDPIVIPLTVTMTAS